MMGIKAKLKSIADAKKYAMAHGQAYLAEVSLKVAVDQHPMQSLLQSEELVTLREAIQILKDVQARAEIEFDQTLL